MLVGGRQKNKRRSNLRSYGSRHGEKFWHEEESKGNFGLRYMQKHGWSKGDGLGHKRQGMKQYIKTTYKNDNLGLGANQQANNTMFQATMCMFNDILSKLGQKKDPNDQNNCNENLNGLSTTSASLAIKQYEARHHLLRPIVCPVLLLSFFFSSSYLQLSKFFCDI